MTEHIDALIRRSFGMAGRQKGSMKSSENRI
jgi:hypothetical protein